MISFGQTFRTYHSACCSCYSIRASYQISSKARLHLVYPPIGHSLHQPKREMAAVQAKRKRRAIESSDEEITEAEPKKALPKKAMDSTDTSSKPMHPMFAKKSAPIKEDLPTSDLRSSPAPELVSPSASHSSEGKLMIKSIAIRIRSGS